MHFFVCAKNDFFLFSVNIFMTCARVGVIELHFSFHLIPKIFLVSLLLFLLEYEDNINKRDLLMLMCCLECLVHDFIKLFPLIHLIFTLRRLQFNIFSIIYISAYISLKNFEKKLNLTMKLHIINNDTFFHIYIRNEIKGRLNTIDERCFSISKSSFVVHEVNHEVVVSHSYRIFESNQF